MTVVKILLTIWGVSLAASWLLFGGETKTRGDRMLLAAATLLGVTALILAALL